MSIECILSLLLIAALAGYVVYFCTRCFRRMEAIAASFEACIERVATTLTEQAANIVRLPTRGKARSGVVMRDLPETRVDEALIGEEF